MLRAVVPVPRDRVLPGPKSSRFQVIDYDGAENQLFPPTAIRVAKDLDDDGFGGLTDAKLPGNADFRNQNVPVDRIEDPRGIRGRTRSTGPLLHMELHGASAVTSVPRAFQEANAYYDPNANAILFGAFDGFIGPSTDRRRGPVDTGLSGDIVAHETTHAVLDGLRGAVPANPACPISSAFHEAFANIVALLSAFSIPALGRTKLGTVGDRGRSRRPRSTGSCAKSGLIGLAEEIGARARRRAATRSGGRRTRRPRRTGGPTRPSRNRIGAARYWSAHHAGHLGMWSKRIQALIGEAGSSSWAAPPRRAPTRRARLEHGHPGDRLHARRWSSSSRFLEAILVSDAEAAPDR